MLPQRPVLRQAVNDIWYGILTIPQQIDTIIDKTEGLICQWQYGACKIDSMKNIFRPIIIPAILVVSLLFTNLIHRSFAIGTTVSLATINQAYTQNFDSLAVTGTSNVTPQGWGFNETGTSLDTNYRAGDGTANSGDTYSFGSNSDRAFGTLQSGSLIPVIGACFTNNTGSPITSLEIAYTGEQWRLGTVTRVDRLDFQYSVDATSLTTGSWANFDTLDFSSPNTTASVGALDGNLAANKTAITGKITGLNIANGATVFIRWTDFNATGADDGLAVDDFSLTPKTGDAPPPPPTITAINAIQGTGSTSPVTGTTVTTVGIVTGVKSNGFFIQSKTADNDPNTSEGIFVFTSSAPPATVVVGNEVQVTGTVAEFIPGADPGSPPLTEISNSPTVSVVSNNNALPTAITLTAADTNPAGSGEQLERYEGMLVSVASLTAVAPTSGTVSEANATSTSNGIFYAVITGLPRPFREPGVELPTVHPATIPRFDGNPERLRIDSDSLIGAEALNVTSGAILTNVTGVLDYGSRTYTILPLPGNQLQANVTGNINFSAVPAANANEFTVASANLERFFDTTDDAGTSDVILTADAFTRRLQKASLALRNVLRSPDIIGIEEMENLLTLQALAAKINSDTVAAGTADPKYVAYLEEGNDIGGIDVGFLVKSARVTVVSVMQEGKATTFINPANGQSDTLNDRPPLLLKAVVNSPEGMPFPLTVIVNHLRSLNSVDDPVDGNRVRQKRRAQAEFLANLIQARQTADPNEKIISIGDYNAFQFNDGLVDSIGTVKGTPTPAELVVLASADLVNPDLTDLIELVPLPERYSYSFSGNAQVIDHELVNASLMNYFSRIAFSRSNADFPEIYRTDANRPERISDHDAAVAYFYFTSRTDRNRRDGGRRDVPSRTKN